MSFLFKTFLMLAFYRLLSFLKISLEQTLVGNRLVRRQTRHQLHITLDIT